MKIRKILNNNAVITLNDRKEEVIVMGKGIAYGKRTGQDIDGDRVIKTYVLNIKNSKDKYLNMLKDIPLEYMEISSKVIEKAREELKIDDSLYISLTDHIHTSIERYKDKLILKNHLLYEVKTFYPKEYKLGLYALDLIEEKYGIRMQNDEAAFLAFHIISSEMNRNVEEIYGITDFIRSLTDIVKDYFHMEFDLDSLAYNRFITHLRFFAVRLFKNQSTSSNESLDNDLLEIMKEKYVEPYLCVSKMQNYIQKVYSYVLSDEEVLYLTIHVAKIISKN